MESTPERNIKGVFFSIVFTIYLIGLILATPYFNYQFIKSNSFISWLFLGEIAPTIKAALWPYYLYMSASDGLEKKTTTLEPADSSVSTNGQLEYVNNSSWAKEDKETYDAFYEAIAAHKQFIHLLKGEDNFTESALIYKLGICVDEMQAATLRINLSRLAKIHSELPIHYRDEFLKSISLCSKIQKAAKTRVLSPETKKDMVNFKIVGDKWFSFFGSHSQQFNRPI